MKYTIVFAVKKHLSSGPRPGGGGGGGLGPA